MLKNTITQFIELLKWNQLYNVTSDSYVEYNEDSNEKDPKFKVGDHIRISEYKIIFAKGYSPRRNFCDK